MGQQWQTSFECNINFVKEKFPQEKAQCADIIDALSDIDEHGNEEYVCAAVKWAKVPKVDPESISDLSIWQKNLFS